MTPEIFLFLLAATVQSGTPILYRKFDFLHYIQTWIIKIPQIGEFLFCNSFYYCLEHLRMSNSQV